jgi:hypothetical protein
MEPTMQDERAVEALSANHVMPGGNIDPIGIRPGGPRYVGCDGPLRAQGAIRLEEPSQRHDAQGDVDQRKLNRGSPYHPSLL